MSKYPVGQTEVARLTEIFTYHAPTGDEQRQRYEEVRAGGLALALLISERCPPSRELSLALTHIQQAVMFANAAIAIHEKPE